MSNILKSLARRVAGWLADLSPNCREATHLAALAARERLSARKRFGLRVHVFLCRFCRRFERQLHRLRGFMATQAGLPAGGLQVRLSEESRDRLRTGLRAARLNHDDLRM